jgi:hypothetical protein
VPEAYETSSPEEAFAVRVTGWSIVALAGGVNEIVCEIFCTGKEWVTESAGANWLLPGWDAVMVQVPAAAGVTVEPLTEHTSMAPEVKVTDSQEDAVADRTTGWSIVALAGGVNEMVWEARTTWNVCVTGSAGWYSAVPPWDAVITHRPAVQGTTVEPEAVHTRRFCERYDTGRPVGQFGPSKISVIDVAVKTTGTPTVVPGTMPKEICC